MNKQQTSQNHPALSFRPVRAAVPAAGLPLPEGNTRPPAGLGFPPRRLPGANGARVQFYWFLAPGMADHYPHDGRVQLYWFLPSGAQLTTAPTAARAAKVALRGCGKTA
jgi:hypothetical protein